MRSAKLDGRPVSSDLHQLSRAVFGQSHRLELMIFIAAAPSGRFTLTDAVQATGVSSASTLQKPLQSLLQAGLVIHAPMEQQRRYRYYQRIHSFAWDFALELGERAKNT